MKRVHIIGKSEEKIRDLREMLLSKGFEIVEENPDLVICYGGDGMFLISERVFPSVPKILLRDSEVGNNAYFGDIEEAIERYKTGKFEIEKIRKIKASWRGRFEARELIGINDIVLRNNLPTEAIRFRYRVNSGDWSKTIIGDGVVVSTPFGSKKGAYFYSITKKSFEKGIGVAFNNVTEELEHLYLNEKDVIEFEIVRGLGVMVSDNNRDYINLEVGDKIKIFLIEDFAKRVVFK